MQSDGVRSGYDIQQLHYTRYLCQVSLVASGGAGSLNDFTEVFIKAQVNGILAASVFHDNTVKQLKKLNQHLSSKILR